jgi:hypothetical protein
LVPEPDCPIYKGIFSCEYAKYAVADIRQGAVLQFLDLAMDEQLLAINNLKDPDS